MWKSEACEATPGRPDPEDSFRALKLEPGVTPPPAREPSGWSRGLAHPTLGFPVGLLPP